MFHIICIDITFDEYLPQCEQKSLCQDLLTTFVFKINNIYIFFKICLKCSNKKQYNDSNIVGFKCMFYVQNQAGKYELYLTACLHYSPEIAELTKCLLCCFFGFLYLLKQIFEFFKKSYCILHSFSW